MTSADSWANVDGGKAKSGCPWAKMDGVGSSYAKMNEGQTTSGGLGA